MPGAPKRCVGGGGEEALRGRVRGAVGFTSATKLTGQKVCAGSVSCLFLSPRSETKEKLQFYVFLILFSKQDLLFPFVGEPVIILVQFSAIW